MIPLAFQRLQTLTELSKLCEETAKQLRSQAWPTVYRRVRTQHLKPVFLGVDKQGNCYFRVNSGTTKGKFWYQTLRFKDLQDGLEIFYSDADFSRRAVVDLIASGDLQVYCNDPSFRYYWQYKAWNRGYGLRKEVRYPRIRNPNQTGSVCKHLCAVLQSLPFFIPQIVHAYQKKGLFPKNWKSLKKSMRKR